MKFEGRKVVQLRRLERRGEEYRFGVHRLWIEKYLGLKEGDLVDITIEKPKKMIPPAEILKLFKKHIPEIRKMSDRKLGLCFSYFRIEKSLRACVDKQRIEKVISDYENNIKTKEGSKFLDDYRLFKKVVPYIENIRKIRKDTNKKDKQLKEELEIGDMVAKFYGCRI